MSIEAPDSWTVAPIATLARIKRGASPRPIQDSRWFSESGHGWVRISDVTSSHRRLLKTSQYLSDLGRAASVEIVPDDLIMSICGTVGHPLFSGIHACIHDGFVVFKDIDTSKVLPEFLYLALQAQAEHFQAQSQPGTQRNLNSTIVGDTEIPLPPLSEQQRIAEILQCVDEAIEKSDAVLTQIQCVQSAQSHSFFSRVADHQLTRELTKSNWKNVRLGQVFSERIEPGADGIPVASVSIDRGLVLRASLERRVQSDLPPEGHSLVRTNDIAYNMMRMWQGACGIAHHDCMVSPAYVVVTPSPDLNPRFAYHMLRSEPVIRLLHAYSQGVVDDRLRLYPRDFFQIPINLPPLAKQLEVAALLDAYTDARQSAEIELEAQSRLRTRLVSDLVSGRVRVPPPATKPGRAVQPAFKRAVFAAEIVHQLHNDAKFGSVKHEKIVYLCEAHLGLDKDLDRHAYKEAAGPYDPKARRSVEGIFVQQKWYQATKVDGHRVVYQPLANAGKHTQYFDRYFGEQKPAIQKMIDLLRPLDTQQCEIVATLYAVWNDFLIDGKQPTDKEIIEAVFEWHPKKREIEEWHWLKALPWMQKKGLVPSGTGERMRVAKK
jgi:type I restriction enzyme S subunit